MKFTANPIAASQEFLKLKDKEQVAVILRGEPRVFYTIWENGKAVEVPENTPGGKFRFRVNVVVNENGVYTAKILEQGTLFYNMLKDLNEEHPLESTVVVIRRTGSGINDTTYSVIPSGKTKFTAALKKQIDAIPLLDLGGNEDDNEKKIFGDTPSVEDEEMPF